MALTPSALRKNIYRILDQILETGESVEINRNGKRFKLMHLPSVNVTDRLIKREGVFNKSADLVAEDESWMQETIEEWKELGLI